MGRFLDNLRARITNAGYGSQNRTISLIASWLSNTLWLIESKFLGLAKETYGQNEVIYACLRLLSQSVPEAPLIAYQQRGSDKSPLPSEHDLMRLIHHPNELMTEYELWELVTLHMAIVGRSTWWKERNNAGQLIGLWPLRPDRVGPRYSSSDQPGERVLWGYNYQVPGSGELVPLPRRDVLAFNFPDPTGESGGIAEGLGPIQALARQIASDNEATKFVGALLANYAAPTVAVRIKGTLKDENEAQLIKNHFRSEFGGSRRGEPAVIDADTEIQVIGFNLRELEFPELREVAESRIAATLGTPAVLVGLRVGLMRSTFNNMTESRRFFAETTLANYWRRFQDQFTADVASEYGEGIICEFDQAQVKALAGALLEQAQPVVDQFKAGAATVNQYRIALKQEPLEPEHGDVLYIPASVTVVAVTEEARAAREARTPVQPSAPQALPTDEDMAEDRDLQPAAKYNPYHGTGGRFTSGGGAVSVSWNPNMTEAQKGRIAQATGAAMPVSGGELAQLHDYAESPEGRRLAKATKTHDEIRTIHDGLKAGELSQPIVSAGKYSSPAITAKYDGTGYGGSFKAGDNIAKFKPSVQVTVYRGRQGEPAGVVMVRVEQNPWAQAPAWSSTTKIREHVNRMPVINKIFAKSEAPAPYASALLSAVIFHGYKPPIATKAAELDEEFTERQMFGLINAALSAIRQIVDEIGFDPAIAETTTTIDTSNGELGIEGAKAVALKAIDPREQAEKQLIEELTRLLAGQQTAALERLQRGEMPSAEELTEGLSRIIGPQLVEIATTESIRLSAEIGVQFDPAVVNVAAQKWAEKYTFNLVKDLTETTRSVLQNSLSKWATTPGMTRGELEKLLEPAFGTARAESIAVTEVTRAHSHAFNQYQQELADEDVESSRIWQTQNDELVCPICRPLNGLPEEKWKDRFSDGPPAHPHCHCGLSLRVNE